MPKRNPRRPNPVDLEVGKNVRIWRLAKGLSQAALAKRLGVTFQQVQKYETGANRITTGRLVKIASVLDAPLASLLVGVDAKDPSKSLAGLIDDARSYRLADAFDAIARAPKSTDLGSFRDAMVKLVETLAKLPQKPKRRRR
jgi:transcriptional regulator with XRE-family HTH domain